MSHIDVDGIVGDVHLVVEAIDAVHVVVAIEVLQEEIHKPTIKIQDTTGAKRVFFFKIIDIDI
jgi:hypothetical protein